MNNATKISLQIPLETTPTSLMTQLTILKHNKRFQKTLLKDYKSRNQRPQQVHKDGHPGRPLLSSIDSPTSKISEYVDFHLHNRTLVRLKHTLKNEMTVIAAFLWLILTQNNFIFNVTNYLQLSGVTMRIKCAVIYGKGHSTT